MNRQQKADWEKYGVMQATDPVAAERGRMFAASRIATDPEVRQRMEDAYGIDFCRVNYPEAYQSGFSKLIDRIKVAIPW